IDTAGSRTASDHVEAGGVELSRSIARGADLRLLLLDSSRPLGDEELELLREVVNLASGSGRSGAHTIYVASKSDLEPAWGEEELRPLIADAPLVRVSTVTAAGLGAL